MRSSCPTESRTGQYSASGEVHFSINKNPSLQFLPVPKQTTRMVRQTQEKVCKDKTSQYPEIGGLVDCASSDLVIFSRGRTMRTADRRGPRLRQCTDTERKETRDGKDRKELLLFLHCFCFFLIVHTAEGLGPGSAGSFCCNGCLRWLCLRSKAALCCQLAAQARVSGEGVGSGEVAG